MEALAAVGVVANFAGIIGIAIQLAEILEKAIDNTRTADERVQRIAIELRVLASTLTDLLTLLNEDQNSSHHHHFTNEQSRNINLSVQQCDKVLQEIALSFSKMGRVAVLDITDEQQRRIQNVHTAVVPFSNLTFKFSVKGRLMWLFKARGILQSVAELNQLKTSLQFIIAVAQTASQIRGRQMEALRPARKKWRLIGFLRRDRKSSALSHGQSTTQAVEAKQQPCIDAASANNIHFGAQKTTANRHNRVEKLLALLAV